MKRWNKVLDLSHIPVIEGVMSVENVMKIREAVLALDPDVEFRETDLKHYDAEMLESVKDRENFLEDLYEWADNNRIYIQHGKEEHAQAT